MSDSRKYRMIVEEKTREGGPIPGDIVRTKFASYMDDAETIDWNSVEWEEWEVLEGKMWKSLKTGAIIGSPNAL